jgi:peptidoglycan/xylan/chitin deacetylase (PgdA/CDA1 family)
MTRHTTKLMKAALSALHYTGVDGLFAPFTAGNGVIFMLHQVSPDVPRDFDPNRILKVTPEFLDSVIGQVRDRGFDIISIDDVPNRLIAPGAQRPFAVFTLDDGYKDNAEYAYPVFKRHGVPFTVYVATEFADGTGDLWWLTLEEALRRLPHVSLEINGGPKSFELGTANTKDAAFETIYWWMRSIDEVKARAITHDLARQAGFDPFAFCRDLVMRWDAVRELAADPLVTIGSHTCAHYSMAKLPAAEVHAQITNSVTRIEAELGQPCRHFSFPYGDETSAGEREFDIARELGLQTAVTTRKGLLRASHAGELTALPRLSLNGDYQDARYIKVLLSGAPFALWDMLNRVRSHKNTTAQSA